ncbi:MAG: hypothetical protein RIC89_16075 [Pseudomonadales bacterium]
MGTTNLFVELVVIGAGVMIWLLLLVFTIVGRPPLAISEAMLLASAIPLLAITYVAGIIWDRIVDVLFEKLWVDRWRPRFFATKTDYYNARRAILTKSERLSELIEYGRSRMRICRAWTLNALLITVSGVAFLFSDHRNEPEFALKVWAVILIGTAFSVGAWFAWASLVKTEYRKIKDQSQYLNMPQENLGEPK